MNGFLLLLPLTLIRYGLLYAVNKNAMKRAAFFPPMVGGERAAFWIYQLSTAMFVGCLCFLHVKTDSLWFFFGIAFYGAGCVIFAWAIVNFASPSGNGVNSKGLYRLSRNPMYVGYFIYFLGCVLLTQSPILLLILLSFQVSSHWMILSEERWCQKTLGEEYLQYQSRVRRYL